MILYHGTNILFDKIDLSKCRPNRDFGSGFYLTSIPDQAEEMAIRKIRIFGEGSVIVKKFEFDDNLLKNNQFKAKIFEKPSKEWAEFILQNRYSKKKHEYDIVVGPIANDSVAFQLERYVQGLIEIETLVKELTYKKLNIQYYFGTQKSINLLKEI